MGIPATGMRHLHNSNMERNQITLFGVVVREWDYDFLGVFSGSELGIPGGIWVKKLEEAEISSVLALFHALHFLG